VFLLEHPRFAHRENGGADFRFSGLSPALRSLRLVRTRPAQWQQAEDLSLSVEGAVQAAPGCEIIFGGTFDPVSAATALRQYHTLHAAMPALRLYGPTSHEVYVRWNLCEVAAGRFDWSVYDRYVELYRKAGTRWTPFIVLGPSYTLPDWYYHSAEACGYTCLEHGQTTAIESLWNPHLRPHVARFLRAFCEHYGKTGRIESILLGVTGNFGEAIYPATKGTGWTAAIHGDYHSHPGFWAGDRYAVASFRRWVAAKYADDARLRAAWGPQAPTLSEVKPFVRREACGERAWLDFLDWYVGAMNEWARFWLQETRKNFSGEIYLCTGGNAAAEHGSDFAAQCKLAAEVGGGVRITNEGSDYQRNFLATRWVASAGRQYGAYFSFEPASHVSPEGVVARIYNATASGARGLHDYWGNLLSSPEASENYRRQIGQFRQRRPTVSIAVYYPQTAMRLAAIRLGPYLEPLRDDFDFDLVSDGQIADGGLDRHKALVLACGNVAETATWRSVADWVKRGGLLLRPGDFGKLQTVEGDASWDHLLFGPDAATERGRALACQSPGRSREFRRFLVQTLRSAAEIDEPTRHMLLLDGEEDGVYATAAADELLWLNGTTHAVEKTLPGQRPTDLPAMTITSQPLRAGSATPGVPAEPR
jgi:hypothetical protein